MNPVWLSLAVLGVALLVSVVTDARKRLIYNWVTLPALVLELVIYAAVGRWDGLRDSLVGALVAAVPFLLASLRGYVGMGDVKLMAVVGAAGGSWIFALLALLYVSIAGGVQALLQLVGARLLGRERPKYVPYAIAIAAGTCAAFVLGPP